MGRIYNLSGIVLTGRERYVHSGFYWLFAVRCSQGTVPWKDEHGLLVSIVIVVRLWPLPTRHFIERTTEFLATSCLSNPFSSVDETAAAIPLSPVDFVYMDDSNVVFRLILACGTHRRLQYLPDQPRFAPFRRMGHQPYN